MLFLGSETLLHLNCMEFCENEIKWCCVVGSGFWAMRCKKVHGTEAFKIRLVKRKSLVHILSLFMFCSCKFTSVLC